MILSVFNWAKFLVVKTGSMVPKLPVNSLVLVFPQKSVFNFGKIPRYSVGEVISFKSPEQKTLITHRVSAVKERNNQIFYQTKGDANESADQTLTPQQNVLGQMVFAVPILGNFVKFLNSFIGLFLIVVIPATFIILHEVLVIQDELKKSKEDETLKISKKTLAGPLIIILLLILATPVYAIFQSQAFLTDNSLSTSETFLEIPSECSAITFSAAPIMGTAGDDNLHGTNGNDLIFALGGNDRVNASAGDDCIVGGDGNDNLKGGSGNDVILGGAGADDIDGGSGNDKIFGDSGADNIDGGSGDDTIHGGADNDTIKGGSGSDQVFGDDGDDTLLGSSGNDVLDGNADINFLDGGSGTDTCINATTKTKCEL